MHCYVCGKYLEMCFLISWDQADVEGGNGAGGSRVLGFEILKITFSENCRSSVVAFSSVFSHWT